ncbi:MAG: hypothetical protein Q9164_001750 [Protoblastenia rupestris]
MHSTTALTTLMAIATTLFTPTSALGINCRGSGACPLASWQNQAPERITQVLRDAVYQTTKSNETFYESGDHIICISGSQTISLTGGAEAGVQAPQGPNAGLSGSFTLSGKLNTGGVCLFPQGAALTLAQIRPLTDAILEHGCGTCGSVPIHFVDQESNDPKDGILTFNYVKNPSCTGECIGADGKVDKVKVRRSARFVKM